MKKVCFLNGHVEEICETVAKTRLLTRISAVGLVTFTRVSIAAVTAEPYHFLYVFVRFQLKETNFPASVTSCYHVRKHMVTLWKHDFFIIPST